MFKRENRLVSGTKFNNSHFSVSPLFILKERENGLTVNRFGIIVSKKIDQKAVGRNKLKRLLRQVLNDLNKNMVPGHDILLITKKEILGKNKEEILFALEKALNKAKIIKE